MLLTLQALVAAELRSSARMAAICEWGAGQRLPAPAGAAAAATAQLEAAAVASAEAERVASSTAVDNKGTHHRIDWSGPVLDVGGDGAAGWQQQERSELTGGGGGGEVTWAAGNSGLARQQAVENMLQGNARLLQWLAH